MIAWKRTNILNQLREINFSNLNGGNILENWLVEWLFPGWFCQPWTANRQYLQRTKSIQKFAVKLNLWIGHIPFVLVYTDVSVLVDTTNRKARKKPQLAYDNSGSYYPAQCFCFLPGIVSRVFRWRKTHLVHIRPGWLPLTKCRQEQAKRNSNHLLVSRTTTTNSIQICIAYGLPWMRYRIIECQASSNEFNWVLASILILTHWFRSTHDCDTKRLVTRHWSTSIP